MSSLHCFFGLELPADGTAATPVLPPKTSLVITQCAVHSVPGVLSSPAPSAASASASPVVKAAADAKKQKLNQKQQKHHTGKEHEGGDAGQDEARDTAGSLSVGVTAATLYVQSHDLPQRIAVCTLSLTDNLFFCPLQLLFSKPVSFSLVPHYPTSASSISSNNNHKSGKKRPRAAAEAEAAAGEGEGEGAAARALTVHLTGYYESIEDEDEEDEEEEDGSEESGSEFNEGN